MKVHFQKIYLILAFSLLVKISFEQQRNIDSISSHLQSQKEDTNKVNSLNELSNQYNLRFKFDSCIQWAKAALNLSQKLDYKKGIVVAFYNLALGYIGLQSITEFNNELTYIQSALTYYEETGDKEKMADCYYLMGRGYYYVEQNMPDALKNTLEALKIYEAINAKTGIADCLRELSVLYSIQGNDDEAIKNLHGALTIYEQLNDSNNIAYTNNIVGQFYLGEKKHAEAFEKFIKAMIIYEKLGSRGEQFGIPWTDGLLGELYESEGEKAYTDGNPGDGDSKYDSALRYYELRYDAEEKGNMSHAECYLELGDYYLKTGKRNLSARVSNLAKSRSFFEKALDKSKERGDKGLISESYDFLVQIDTLVGNYKDAFSNYVKANQYKDSIVNDEEAKKTEQVKMQYEFDKKDAIAKTEQLKKDAAASRVRNIQYVVIGTFLLLAIAFYWISVQKQKAKRRVEKAYQDLKGTQAQLIQSEKMASLGQLTAGIAHEIQNPLNFVNNFSDVNNELIEELKSELATGNKQLAEEIANDIFRNNEKINLHGKRADSIVKGMLQHSRSTSSIKEATNINTLADEYLRLSYHGLRAKDKSFNVTMKTDFDQSIGNINIIPQDIGRVLLNLYTNAFYAVNEKSQIPIAIGTNEKEKFDPTVFVSTKKEGNKVLISVKDNGNGIPQNIVDKIFQPFFTTKPTGQGTGLGLSLSYDIIKAHGGEIKVNTVEREFTEFVIQLPIA